MIYINNVVKVKQMHLRISLPKLIILFLVIAEYKYFFLPSDLESFFVKFNNADRNFIKEIICGCFLLLQMRTCLKVFKSDSIAQWFLLYSGLMTISAFLSYIKYGYLSITILGLVNVLYLFFLFATLRVFIEKNSFTSLISIITIVNIVAVLLLLFQILMYSRNGYLFLNIWWNGGSPYIRNGMIRITECLGMILLSFGISLSMLVYYNVNNKWLHLVNTFLSGLYLMVCNTRMFTAIAIILIILAVVYGYHANSISSLILKTLIVLIGSFLALRYGTNLFDRINIIGTNEYSYVIRLETYKYYASLIPRCIFNGFYFMDFSNSPLLSTIHGNMGLFFPDDVGLLGEIIKYGLGIGIWYLVCVIFSIKQAIRFGKSYYICVTVATIFITTLATLGLLQPARMFILAFGMLIISRPDRFANGALSRTAGKK